MSAVRVTRLDPWVGCVIACEPGVAHVLTDGGEVRASFGGCLLAEIARDRSRVPAPGDWVVLRRWPDERVTIEDAWPRHERHAQVLPLAPRR